MEDQSKKTMRHFYCQDHLWELYEAMSADFDCSIDYLINEAARHYARSLRSSPGRLLSSLTEAGRDNPKTGRNFYCRDGLWVLYEAMARDSRCSIDTLLNEAMLHYGRSKGYHPQPPSPTQNPTPSTSQEPTLQEPNVSQAFPTRAARGARRYFLTQGPNDAVLLAKSFAFLRAGFFQKPSLAWLRSVFGQDLARPNLLPLVGYGAPSLPGLEVSDFSPQRFAVVISERDTYWVGGDPIKLMAIFPGARGQVALLDVWDEASHVASLPLCFGAHDTAVAALHDLPAGDYKVTLRDGDPNEPPCTFRVSSEPPTLAESGYAIPGVYLQSGEGKAAPFYLRQQGEKAELLVRAPVAQGAVVLLDPTYPAKRTDALDTKKVQHPSTYDAVYQAAEKLYHNKRYMEARATFIQARSEQRPPHPYYAYNIACIEALLGNKPQALLWLRTAIRDGWEELFHMSQDEDLASLRGSPELTALTSGGRTQLRFDTLQPDAVIELPGASWVLCMAAYVEGIPWEGWALRWQGPRGAWAAVSVGG